MCCVVFTPVSHVLCLHKNAGARARAASNGEGERASAHPAESARMPTDATRTAVLRAEYLAAAACHRVALVRRQAVSGLPAADGRGADAVERDALHRRRLALLALRSQARNADEAVLPASFVEATLGKRAASILFQPPRPSITTVRREAPGDATDDALLGHPRALWEVGAALQRTLWDDEPPPAEGRAVEAAGETKAEAKMAPPTEAASASSSSWQDELLCQVASDAAPVATARTRTRTQLTRARRELIARLCCRLQLGWDELDAVDARLVMALTSQAAHELNLSRHAQQPGGPATAFSMLAQFAPPPNGAPPAGSGPGSAAAAEAATAAAAAMAADANTAALAADETRLLEASRGRLCAQLEPVATALEALEALCPAAANLGAHALTRLRQPAPSVASSGNAARQLAHEYRALDEARHRLGALSHRGGGSSAARANGAAPPPPPPPPPPPMERLAIPPAHRPQQWPLVGIEMWSPSPRGRE